MNISSRTNTNKDLYRLIENLNVKINKLDNQLKHKSEENVGLKTQDVKQINQKQQINVKPSNIKQSNLLETKQNVKDLVKTNQVKNNVLKPNVVKQVINQPINQTINKPNFISNLPSQLLMTTIRAYSISYPKNQDQNKKYIGLMFDDNFNDFTTDSNDNSNTKISFINLNKGNNIINYSICIDVDESNLYQYVNSICLGIKEKSSSKVRIIKGSKYMFDTGNKNLITNGKIIINNTIIYMSEENEELCMIADLYPSCKINSSKSLIKLLLL